MQLPTATPLGVEPAAAAEEPAAGAGGSEGGRTAEVQLQQQVDTVQGLLAAAAGFGLEDCWQWKPLLDGKQVSRDTLAKAAVQVITQCRLSMHAH